MTHDSDSCPLLGSLGTLINHPNAGSPINHALELPLVVAILVVGGMLGGSRHASVARVFVVGSFGMLALSPVIWNHYLVMLIAPGVFGVAEFSRRLSHLSSVLNRT